MSFILPQLNESIQNKNNSDNSPCVRTLYNIRFCEMSRVVS